MIRPGLGTSTQDALKRAIAALEEQLKDDFLHPLLRLELVHIVEELTNIITVARPYEATLVPLFNDAQYTTTEKYDKPEEVVALINKGNVNVTAQIHYLNPVTYKKLLLVRFTTNSTGNIARCRTYKELFSIKHVLIQNYLRAFLPSGLPQN